MRLTVKNCSQLSIACSWVPSRTSARLKAAIEGKPHGEAQIHAKQTHSVELPSRHVALDISIADEDGTLHTEKLTLSLRRRRGRTWRTTPTPETSSWRAFLKKDGTRRYTLILLPRRDLSSFLSELSDDLPLSSLLLPGTHDTMAFYGWPISQCQYLEDALLAQLNSGIRVLDIRLAIVDQTLIAYHGIYPERAPFLFILATLEAFLSAHPRETLVMSVMQEAGGDEHSPSMFSQLVREEMQVEGRMGQGMFFLENRVPLLGEVRGKVVLLSRFGGNGDGWENGLEGIGIHPTQWPNSVKEGFEWELKGTLVRTQDWYDISSFLAIPEKTARAIEFLLLSTSEISSSLSTSALLSEKTPSHPSDRPVLNITFLSAASFPFANPPTVAQGFGWPSWGLGVEGVNSRVTGWLLDRLAGDGGEEIKGWVVADFFSTPDRGLPPLLVEFNFLR